LNFPTCHPLNMSHAKDVFRDADLVICLDTRDWERPTTELVSATRQVTSIVPATAKWIDIGFGDLGLSSWTFDYQRLHHAQLQILADTTIAIPEITRLLDARIADDPTLREGIRARRFDTAARSRALREKWAQEAKVDWDASPITLPRLASEVWSAIKDEDWVLTAGTLENWARKLWDFDEPYRHPGRSLGTATQFGISMGVALAHREAKRLVVDLQPDGDLMFDAGAMWVAAKHRIPMLVVMHNNRAYYNDWEHQIRMAKLRGTPLERAHIGMDLDDPAPDFAAMAKSMGWYAEGPFVSPEGLGAALERAIARVKAGQPALLDTVTQKR
jgi:acetolactate synthase-1/2/3 large subunit